MIVLFPLKNASRNSSKDQEETVHDGSCDCLQLKKTHSIFLLAPSQKFYASFISIEQTCASSKILCLV